jgi:hypothetical protein
MRYFMGYDTKESEAFSVAQHSVRRESQDGWFLPFSALHLPTLREAGLYTRPTSTRDGRLWDDISGAYMSTEHANSRFLVPHLAKTGWALFTDCDIILRRPIQDIMEQAIDKYAVMVVKHNYAPVQKMKMDGQLQQLYSRKNWSSVMLFNCDHPANQRLNVEMVNTLPGRDLHRFCWLKDEEIGELTQDWNWLVGHSDPGIAPAIVHFTEGLPSMPGYEDCAFANEWREVRAAWLGSSALNL